MFFLLRMAFWLGLAFVLLPSGAKQTVPTAITACGQAGARIVHSFMRATPPANQSVAAAKPARLSHPSQDTLTAADTAPAWRGPRGDLHKKNGA
jgi:hypothetical protein